MSEQTKRQRIYGVGRGKLNDDERIAIATLLVKAGYTVRIGCERPSGKPNSANIYFVEYWFEV